MIFVFLCMCAKSLQLCSALCDPADCKADPDCSVGGILQARTQVDCHALPGDLPNPGMKSAFSTTSTTWEAHISLYESILNFN